MLTEFKRAYKKQDYRHAIECLHTYIDQEVNQDDKPQVCDTLIDIADCHLKLATQKVAENIDYMSACHILNNAVIVIASSVLKGKTGETHVLERLRQAVSHLALDFKDFSDSQLSRILPLCLFSKGMLAYTNSRFVIILEPMQFNQQVKDGLRKLNLTEADPCIVGGVTSKYLNFRVNGRDIKTNDIDIVSNKHPILINEAFKQSDLFGQVRQVVSLWLHQYRFECVQYLQGEQYEVDMRARAATTNAFYYSLNRQQFFCLQESLIDLFKQRMRVFGDPMQRFERQPCLILRVIGDAARFGFEIEQETAQAIQAQKKHLHKINPDKLYYLFQRCFAHGCSKDCFDLLSRYQLLGDLFPFLNSSHHSHDGLNSQLTRFFSECDQQLLRGEALDMLKILEFLLVPHFNAKQALFKDLNGQLEAEIKQILARSLGRLRLPPPVEQALIQNLCLRYGTFKKLEKTEVSNGMQFNNTI